MRRLLTAIAMLVLAAGSTACTEMLAAGAGAGAGYIAGQEEAEDD